MLANANPRADAVLAPDPTTREIVAVCAKHSVAYGSPDDLVGFMRALHENKHLAMDFWSTVARLTKERRGWVTEPDWLLIAIIEGVTGQSVAVATASPGAQRLLVRKLASMLAGQDVPSPAEEDPAEFAPEPRDSNSVRSHVADAELADGAGVVPIAPRAQAAGSSTPMPPEPSIAIPGPNSISSGDEKLPLRYEKLSAREVKPRLTLEPTPRFAAAQELSLREREHDRQIVASEQIVANRIAASDESDRPMAIPLAGYANASAEGIVSGRMMLGGLLIALLAGSGFLVAHYRNSGGLDSLSASFRTGLGSTMTALRGHPNAPSPLHVDQPEVPAPASANGGAATSGTDVAPVNHSGSLPQSVPVVPAIRPRPETPAETHAPAQSRVASNYDPVESGNEANAGTPEVAARVVVPADEMKDRLISSRVPVYPEGTIGADARRVVVIQAIVSSRGTVEHPHVIEGDPALRRAAIDAASKWRYRPYLLNGEPVDISTTISVDFSGND